MNNLIFFSVRRIPFASIALLSASICVLISVPEGFCLNKDDGSIEGQAKYAAAALKSEGFEQKEKELIKSGDRETAVVWLDRAVKVFPANLNLVLEEIDCLLAIGRPEQAVKILDGLPSDQRDDIAFLISRTKVLIQLGRLDEALNLCDLFNFVDDAFILRSQIYFRLGKQNEAVEQAQTAYYDCVSLNQNSTEAIANLKAIGAEVPSNVVPIVSGNEAVFGVVNKLLAAGTPTKPSLEKIFDRQFDSHSQLRHGLCAVDYGNLFFRIDYVAQPEPRKLTVGIDTKQATITKEELAQRYPGGTYNPGSHSSCEMFGSSYKYSQGNADVWFEFWDDGFRPVKIISIYWNGPSS